MRDRDYIEFVESATESLRLTAFLVCGDWHRADDVVQDALYKLYLCWPKVDRTSNPLAYARKIVVNTALDSARRPWRREVSTDDLPLDRSVSDDYAVRHAERDEVLNALRRLAPRQRACLVLRYYEDLTIEQTADVLGCTTGTVKSQSSHGLETLRQAIEQTRQLGRVL